MGTYRLHAAADRLLDALLDARAVELELLDGLSDTQMLGERAHFLEPPIWEMGHVGWFQELWLSRHLDGEATLLPGSDGIYDSFNVSYRQRWDHRYPSRKQTAEYISKVLRRSVDRLESRTPTAEDAYFYTLAAQHEDMHAENLILILQSLGYARPHWSRFDPAATSPPVVSDYQLRDVAVPGGTFLLGASPDEPFVFDNEKWAHPVVVAPFSIASTPVTNADFQAFVDDGGYRRRELWDRRGWDWRRREQAEHPVFWARGDDGRWYERSFDAMATLRHGIRSCTSTGTRRTRTAAGLAGACQPRPSGRSQRPSSRRPAASGVSPGATTHRRPPARTWTSAPAGPSTCARCPRATAPPAAGK